MALTKEIFKLLDDTSEPLKKRLKIADNAFKSPELSIQHREFLLLRWIGSLDKNSSPEIWQQCKQWITSEQFKSLNRNDITADDFVFLTDVILEHLKSCTDTKTIDDIITCTTSLIESGCFQQHFKCDLDKYCEFISDIISNLHDEDLFLKFIKNEHLFSKQYTTLDNFANHFFDHVLATLCRAVLKYEGNEVVLEETIKVAQKCLFHKSSKSFTEYFKTIFDGEDSDKPIFPDLLLKKIKTVFKNSPNEEATCCFRIVFNAFCSSFSTDHSMIYKFLVLLTNILGFDVTKSFDVKNISKVGRTKASFEKSLQILVVLFEVTAKVNCTLESKIGSTSFADFLQNILKTVIAVTRRPDENCYKLLLFAININPLVIEPIIGSVVAYIMLVDNGDCRNLYEKSMVAIFEVFAKLHRTQNLVSKMIPAVKDALDGKVLRDEESVYVFRGSVNAVSDVIIEYNIEHVFPTAVLEDFNRCMTLLASWQVMNLYKTLLFHLGATLQNDLLTIGSDDNKILYVQIICTLLTEFLSSVRTAEYTVPSRVLEKFVKCMEEHKDILAKFGTALVSMEHNRKLMRSYLNVCYNWAELYMVLSYYSFNNEVSMKRRLDLDFSSCNITYLHSYLATEQWCLISQRINNFGEKPCKQIMEKLCVQKLRAMMIFEQQVPDEVISSVTKDVSNSVNDFYEYLIADRFSLSTLLSNMDRAAFLKISESVLRDVTESQRCAVFKNIADSRMLSTALLYSCVHKISKLHRLKRKHGESDIVAFVNTKVVKTFTEEEFFENCVDLKGSCDVIKNSFNEKITKNAKIKIDEVKMSALIGVVKKLPITQFTENNQSILFMFLSSLLIDFKRIEVSGGLRDDVENLLIGIAQHGVLELPIKSDDLITYIIQNVNRYLDMFNCVLNNATKNGDNMKKLKNCVNLITKDLSSPENLNCCINLLKFLHKNKKSKFSPEMKVILEGYKNKVCQRIVQEIDENSDTTSLEAYVLVFAMYLTSNDEESVAKLEKHLQKYVDAAMDSTKNVDARGFLLLFITLLQHKSRFEAIVTSDFMLRIWNFSKGNMQLDDADLYSKLVVAIFEHISNEQFQELSDDLLRTTVLALSEEDLTSYRKCLRIWNSIIGCSFNPQKTQIWQQCIQQHLMQVNRIYCAEKKDIGGDIIKFQSNLVQATHLLLTTATLEIIFYTISRLLRNEEEFHKTFQSCVSVMESLLKYRKSLLSDHIPSFLQRYRLLVHQLCQQGDSNKALSNVQLQNVSDCAHCLEKLTHNFLGLNKDFASVSMYVIADILNEYETVTLYPAVKLHLNNCLYTLIGLCDQYAISHLMRVLSTASTEIFKLLYETYKKYYRFVGKV